MDEVGIKGETGYLGTFFNNASKKIIVYCNRTLNEKYAIKSFYFRDISDTYYKKLITGAEFETYEDPVTDPKYPFLFFNVLQHQPDHAGISWKSVSRVDLFSTEVSVLVQESSLVLPAPYSRGWVSNLLGISDDCKTLYCKLGLEHPEDVVIEYWLSEIEVETCRIELLTQLKGIWW